MYLPESGFVPQTRNDMLITSFNFFKQHGYQGSYEEFRISNTATWLDANLFPQLDRYQDQLVTILHNIWHTLHSMYGTIEQGVGSAQGPFIRELRKHCEGVFINTPNYDSTLAAGTISIYLDNAQDMAKIKAALANIAWPGMVSSVNSNAPQTAHSQTHQLSVEFINGQCFSYSLYNLHPSDYSPIHIRIQLSYKVGTVRYQDSQLLAHVSQALAQDLQIGKTLYVESFLQHQAFPNLASMHLTWSTDGEEWHAGNYHTANWQRLQVATLSIGEVN